MKRLLPFASMVLAGCLASAAPTTGPTLVGLAQGTRTGLFPQPRSGISLPAAEGSGPTMERVVAEFERATGIHLVIGVAARNALAQTPCGLQGPLEIPAARVYPVIESILAQHDFVLLPMHLEEPRMLALETVGGRSRNDVRQNALRVESDALPSLREHSALLVQTVVDLDPIDVRHLANSLRSLLTDNSTQQIVPIGNSNQVLVLGRAPQVADWVELLRAAAARERELMEEHRRRQDAAPKKGGSAN